MLEKVINALLHLGNFSFHIVHGFPRITFIQIIICDSLNTFIDRSPTVLVYRQYICTGFYCNPYGIYVEIITGLK